MNSIINTVFNTITSPRKSFEEITEDQDHYYASAVIIFIASCTLTFSVSLVGDLLLLGNKKHSDIPVMSHAIQLIQTT